MFAMNNRNATHLDNITISSAAPQVESIPHSSIWEPELQHLAAKADAILSWVACTFIVVMIIFSITKCVYTSGWRIFDLRQTGVSFPQRPELFVILLSTIPVIISTLGRPIIPKNSPAIRDFVLGWAGCQGRMFLDLFTRTASLYHAIYWSYRLEIISAIRRTQFLLYALRKRAVDDSPEAQRHFEILCKRIIPGCIYVAAFFITLPVCFSMERTQVHSTDFKGGPIYNFYLYYNLIFLVTVPLIAMVVRFYHLSSAKGSQSRIPYRLRCYYVTFILLNIPIFVLLLTSEILHAISRKGDIETVRFGNGVIIAMTTYHASFILKPLVYTTGCNCICCSKECMDTHPKVGYIVQYWSTPQHKQKKDRFVSLPREEL